MLLEYLEKRADILNSRLEKNKEKMEHNLIAIVESNNKIKEIDSSVDEASKIFSVKTRGEGGFRNQEINDLEIRINAYLTENESIQRLINKIQNELDIVNLCIENARNNDVSRETSDKEQVEIVSTDDSNEIISIEKDNEKRNIIDKLKLCKSICNVDPDRTKIELDNIINIIENE